MKAEYLVVDTGGFIAGDNLWELGQNLYTLNEVIAEIRDKPTRRRLELLPYGLKIKSPSDNAFKVVTEFSRKTGDYASLSATDIMVIALTYDLEVEEHGAGHLATEPKMSKTVDYYQPKKGISDADKKIDGFYNPGSSAGEKKDKTEDEDFSAFQFWREPIPEIPLDFDLDLDNGPEIQTSDGQQCPLSEQELQNLDSFLAARSFILEFGVSQVDACVAGLLTSDTASKYNNIKRWFNHIQSYDQNKQKQQNLSLEKIFAKIGDGFDFGIEDVIVDGASVSASGEPVSSDEGVGLNDDVEESESGDESESDDDAGWITPSNIVQIKNKNAVDEKVDNVKVACMTTDFAMQNVLKQIGLNIIGTTGMLIRETKTWLLRCHACFNTTPKMDKKFCPKCGNNTLKRVSVTLNPDGSQIVHISTRRVLTGRGKKFPLPAPRGGKHAQNPRLFEDQPMPQQRIKKKAMQKNNPMDSDWIAGNSPFTIKDVTSRSAMLGLRDQGNRQTHVTGNYWDQKNPNASRKSTGSKKKK